MTPEIVTELRTVVGHIDAVRAEVAARAAAPIVPTEAELAAELEELTTHLETPTDPPEPGEGDEITAEGIAASLTIDSEALGRAVGEALAPTIAALAASAYETNGPGRVTRLSEYRPVSALPVVTNEGEQAPAALATITAAADIPGIPANSPLQGFDQVVEAFQARAGGLSFRFPNDAAADYRPEHSMILGEKVPVARVESHYPEDRWIRGGSVSVAKQVEHVTSPDAMAASGGLCAPVAPFYTQIVVADSMRPVAAALPTFGADRGGLRYVPPPTLASLIAESPDPNPYFLGDAVGVETVAEDAAGGSKLCLDVPCNTIQEVDIDIIWRCLQFGNVTARTFPEQVEAFVRLVNAAWAAAAETVLLDGISAASTPVTLHKTFGTARQVLAQLGRAASYLRNHNRTDPTLTVRVLLPAWVRDAMRADMAGTFAGSMDFFSYADALIDDQLAEYNITASWYIDTKTGGSQMFAAAVASDPLPSFPSTIDAFMFFEGNFLHLDAGILDLGIIRDSTLTALNKFRNFGESFENVVFIGPEALELTLTACPDGGLAAAYVIGSQACTSYQ